LTPVSRFAESPGRLVRRAGLFLTLSLLAGVVLAQVPSEASFPATDGGTVFAHLYEGGSHGVVLAHGAVFDKESWTELAGHLQEAGLTVLAIDFRGYGTSGPATGRSGLENDLLGAVAFLRASGADPVSIVGGSMGAAAAMRAVVVGKVSVDRLVLLAPPPTDLAGNLRAGRTLFVVSEGDRLRTSVERDHRLAAGDKRLEILPSGAHAQHIFGTDQGETLTRLIVDFLTAD